jgi:hypothetical protein
VLVPQERRGPVLLLLTSLVLLALAGIVSQSGGFGFDVPWGRVSSRDPVRPLIAGLLCLLILVRWRGGRGLASAAGTVSIWLDRLAPLAAVGGAAIAAWLGIRYGAHVAGGADPYGYISQSDLWLRGALVIDFSTLGPLPWRNVEWTLSPLGYRPGTAPYTIVPTYAPGLPMLMAACQAALGPSAKFLVVPLCAAVTVWATYLLGSRLYDRSAGAVAACLLAASPVFLFQTMWPMSDVPGAAFWTLSLAAACSGGRGAPLAAGIFAGVAILVRPNLFPLATVPLVLIAGHHVAHGVRKALVRAGVACAGLLPAVFAIAILNTYWYGAPARSGYGSVESLYGAGHVWPNLQRYSTWLLETETAFVLLAVLPLLTARLGPSGLHVRRTHVRAGAALFGALLTILYAFYLVFDQWWYLRFFLPAFPLILVLATAGLRDLLHRVHLNAGPAALLVAAPLAVWLIQAGADRAVYGLQRQEHGYIGIARAVSSLVPQDAIVLAMQHSGSLRYYSGRLTLRYDRLPASQLDLVVTSMRARGRPVYLLVEDWEAPQFVGRYREHSCRGALDWEPLLVWQDVRKARLYDLGAARCVPAATARR